MIAAVRVLASGMSWSEGPLWIPQSGVIRVSDLRANRVLDVSPDGGYRVHLGPPDVDFPNGRTLDAFGRVVQCSQGGRRVERETIAGAEPLVIDFEGARLNSPNDVALAQDGSLWFTDPSYGIGADAADGHPGVEEYGGRFVFRFSEAVGTLEPVIVELDQPNGIAFSPDGSVLYVSDTGSGEGAVFAWDVKGSRCRDPRELCRPPVGMVDGFCVDPLGRLWASTGDGVALFDADGELLLHHELGETTTNCALGGAAGTQLIVTGARTVFALDLDGT